MNIGESIKHLREVQNINQKDFASLIGIKPSSLSKIENSISLPSVDTLTKLCNNFNISADKLLNINVTETINSFSNDEIAVIEVYRNIADKEQAFSLLKAMKKIEVKAESITSMIS